MEKLSRTQGPECCRKVVQYYISITGRPENWNAGGPRIALHCEECHGRIVWTHANGWGRE